jgi:GNAT superfamily N-acetyltransferase
MELTQRAAVEAAYARSLGADPVDLSEDRVVVVERPPEVAWATAIVATFAAASLVSVPSWLLDAAAELSPAEHSLPGRSLTAHRAVTGAPYLERLASRARDLGHDVAVHGPSIGWSLRAVPPPPAVPPDLRIEAVDAAWLNARIPSGELPNGAGPADGSSGREFRNLYGVAALDATGRVVAAAGVFDTYGLHEIGVDVAPGHRGRGLGTAVVAAAVHAILGRGAVPFYGCGPSNIRSQRTAISAGFVPVCADATIA